MSISEPIGIGIAIGVAIGLAIDNITMGIGVGIALALAIGLAISARKHERIGPSDPDVRFHHCARPRLGSGRKGGQQGQTLGRSRGGFTTKIHAKADNSGDIIAFDLTGGQVADTTRFETLLDIGPDITPRAALGDKGYSSKANRAAARTRGIVSRLEGSPYGTGPC